MYQEISERSEGLTMEPKESQEPQLSVVNAQLDIVEKQARSDEPRVPLAESVILETSRRSTRKRDLPQTESSPPIQKKKRKSSEAKTEAEFESIWICSECKEAECMVQPEADQLLICEGGCKRVFHFSCAGLKELPGEDEQYVCNDCEQKRHACCLCNEYGEDDTDVFCCSKDSCGLFFHEACLFMQNVDVDVVQNDDATSKRRFVCPAHKCWSCTQHEMMAREHAADDDTDNATQNKSKTKRKRKSKGSGNFQSKRESALQVRVPSNQNAQLSNDSPAIEVSVLPDSLSSVLYTTHGSIS